jgi:hypothetical protein
VMYTLRLEISARFVRSVRTSFATKYETPNEGEYIL